MKSAAEIMGMAWPVIALNLCRRLAAQVKPTPPRQPFDPLNPANAEAADEHFPRLVRATAKSVGIPITPTPVHEKLESGEAGALLGDAWMSMLGTDDWRKICHGLAQAVDADSANCPHWPEGWRDMHARANRG